VIAASEPAPAGTQRPSRDDVVLAVAGLRKSYGDNEVLRGLDFAIHRGECFGLLGPNGAGKTTTLRMISTLIEPTAGDANVSGADLRTDSRGVRSRVGYVAQGGSTGDDELVIDELVLQARLSA